MEKRNEFKKQKQDRFKKIIVFSLLIWMICANVDLKIKDAQTFVYSSQFFKKYDATEELEIFNNIKVANDGLVFIASGSSGVQVLDTKQDFKIVQKFRSTEYIKGFAVTSDSNYIFLPYQGRITIFDFSNRKQFIQIAQDNSDIVVVEMVLNSTEDILFIFSESGDIRAINVANKKSPFHIGSDILQGRQIQDGMISRDDNWLIVCQNFQGMSVYKIQKNIDSTISYKLAGSYSGNDAFSYGAVLTYDMKLIITFDTYLGVCFADFTVATSADLNANPLELEYYLKWWWPASFTIPAPQSICLSKDNNFLFIGVRAAGVFIIDISDRKSPILYHNIFLDQHGLSVKLSPDQSQLYFANAQSFLIFQKISPNLNQQYINFFNNHLSVGYIIEDSDYLEHCYIDDSRDLYFGAFDNGGLYVFDISDPQNMKPLTKSFFPPNSETFIDAIAFLRDKRYAVVPMVDPQKKYIIGVYDTKFNLIAPAKYSLEFIQGVEYEDSSYITDFAINHSETLLFGTLADCILVFDIENIGFFQLIQTWKFEQSMRGVSSGIAITSDNQYIIGSIRSHGYFILDVKDIKNIKMIKFIDSLGAETVNASKISQNYCFLVDGLGGVKILDLSQLPKVSFISNINVPGWSNHIQLLNNEKIMTISTTDRSMFTMVDISDIKNPFIVSEYLYELQNGMSSCSYENNSYTFINNNIGIRSLPTRGNVITHFEIQEVLGYSDELKQFQYKKLEVGDVIKVGQTVNISIVFLYQPYDITIVEIKLYQNQKMHNQPSWISFDPYAVSITINVVKDAIDSFHSEDSLLNIVIAKTLKPLYKTDFIFTVGECNTDITKSTLIFEYIKQKGIIDDQNLVHPNFENNNYQEDIVVDTYTYADDNEKNCLSKKIKYSLLSSIQYNPIYLFMQSSLQLIMDPGQNMEYIQSISKLATVSIDIPKLTGFFIFVNQITVNILINDEKNEITIQGSLHNINQYLKNKIIFFPNSPNNLHTINATLLIEDNINYPIQKKLLISQIPFIVEKKNLELNSDPKLRLQNQFSEQYSHGEIEILSDFVFEFNVDTFVNPDVGSVKYHVYYKSDGEYIILNQNTWVQFNSQYNKIYGNPPQNNFNSVLKIKVVGDDGYTKVSDTFEIKVNKLPVMFVIQWISQIFGPLIGAIGFYKYRNYFYNAFFKNKNRYSKVIAKVNEEFVMKIPLLSVEVKQAKQMIQNLLQKINKSSGSINLRKVTKRNTIKIKNDLPELDDFEQELENKFQNQASVQQNIEHKQNQGQQLQNKLDFESNQDFQNVEERDKDYTSSKKVWNTDKDDITEQFHDRILKAKPYYPKTQAEKRYLNGEGKINMDAIINEMISNKITFEIVGKTLEAAAYKEELNNKKSALFKSIKYLFARYFISLDKKSFLVSEYIRYYGLRNCFIYTQNDWYKQFVDIYSDDSHDIYGHTVVFPKIKLIMENINIALLHLKLISSKLQNLQSLVSKGINPHLIKYVLKADAVGIQLETPSSLFPSVGESIHLKSHEFRAVESFKYSPGGSCIFFKKLLNMQYDPYGPKENYQFPNWLQLIMQPGVIILSGTPQIQDMEEVLIRFYGTQDYIYRSFTLRVQDPLGNSSRSQVASSNVKYKTKVGKKAIELPLMQQEKNSDQFIDDNMDSILDLDTNDKKDYIHHRASQFSKITESPLRLNQSPQVPIINNSEQKTSMFKELDLAK